jgi:cbb3-type cytochrome oxidase subunit 3
MLSARAYDFNAESGLDKTANQAGYSDYLKSLTPEGVASKVVGQVLTFLGVVFLGLMIYGGIVWMLASGNEAKVDEAKNIITAGIIGLVIVMAAYAISYFVIKYFSTQTLV